jgi:hypothetical protein
MIMGKSEIIRKLTRSLYVLKQNIKATPSTIKIKPETAGRFHEKIKGIIIISAGINCIKKDISSSKNEVLPVKASKANKEKNMMNRTESILGSHMNLTDLTEKLIILSPYFNGSYCHYNMWSILFPDKCPSNA